MLNTWLQKQANQINPMPSNQSGKQTPKIQNSEHDIKNTTQLSNTFP